MTLINSLAEALKRKKKEENIGKERGKANNQLKETSPPTSVGQKIPKPNSK